MTKHQRKNVVVTFADQHYLFAAKQLFSSLYWNSGWHGDYMLFTPLNTPQELLGWFTNRGILVKQSPSPAHFGDQNTFPFTLYLVLYVFTLEFKQWAHVVYLDADVLTRGSIDYLTRLTSFAAPPDILDQKLSEQFRFRHVKTHPYSPSRYLGMSNDEYRLRYTKLKCRFDLSLPMFNAGVFSLNTDIVTPQTFDQLVALADDFGRISSFPPQGELNLLFYKKWQRLPRVFGAFPLYWKKFYWIAPKKLKAVVLHFAASEKPWEEDNPFYGEWKKNFDRADSFRATAPQAAAWFMPDRMIKRVERNVFFRKIILYFYLMYDRAAGRAGFFLKRRFPKVYLFLKQYKS